MPHRVVRTIRTMLAVVLGVGFGCGEDDGAAGGPSAASIADACQAYCEKARVCDDETEMAECVADCEDRTGDCMADEQGQVVADLNACADESCDDLTLCTIGAGFQCAFGL